MMSIILLLLFEEEEEIDEENGFCIIGEADDDNISLEEHEG